MKAKREEKGHLKVRILLAIFLVLAASVLLLYCTSISKLPPYVGRPLTAEEEKKIIEQNSPLTEFVYLTSNADFPRAGKIQKITIHHMAGNLSLEELGNSFSKRDRRVSANYAIDSEGRIALYVEEGNRAWTSGDKENDDMAVTIEVANDQLGDDWHVSSAAYDALIELCADICKRNGISELVFTGDADGSLTLHYMFYEDTECPGPYLKAKMPEIAASVNRRLAEDGRIAPSVPD